MAKNSKPNTPAESQDAGTPSAVDVSQDQTVPAGPLPDPVGTPSLSAESAEATREPAATMPQTAPPAPAAEMQPAPPAEAPTPAPAPIAPPPPAPVTPPPPKPPKTPPAVKKGPRRMRAVRACFHHGRYYEKDAEATFLDGDDVPPHFVSAD